MMALSSCGGCRTGASCITLNGHTSGCHQPGLLAGWGRPGQRIFRDDTVKLWRVSDWSELRTLKRAHGLGQQPGLSPDGASWPAGQEWRSEAVAGVGRERVAHPERAYIYYQQPGLLAGWSCPGQRVRGSTPLSCGGYRTGASCAP
jgi:hypothetical protein